MRKLLVILHITIIQFSVAQTKTTCCAKAAELITLLEKNHIRPLPQDSIFETFLFEEIIQTLDPQRILYAQEDIVRLGSIRKTLLKKLKNNDLQLLQDIGSSFKGKIIEYEKWLVDFLSKPVDFSAHEFYEIFHELLPRPADTKTLLNHRKQLVKFELLESLYKRQRAEGEAKNILAFEKELAEAWLTKERNRVKEMLNPEIGFDAFIMETILKSIAQIYDPHTEYLTYQETENFNASLSDRALDFGFEISENEKGELIVQRMLPGGPAWNTNEINVGDVLIGLVRPGGKISDFTLLDSEEVYEILQDAALAQAEIIIRKPDGQIRNVLLVKEEVEQFENIVNGFLLSGKNKVGYITLPAFYSQWKTEKVQGCAADVAKEIIKLKKEKIEGLIIDLRYNGGGSLHEALELAGIFIDTGPLILYQNRQTPVIAIKDLNKGTIYDGPLIIMVNGFSASASELVAATLQDYNRAIIVGSTTFGKATGQEILPFAAQPAQQNEGSESFIKVTTDRLYRITGKSYQLKGVAPDIPMHDLTVSIPDRERYHRHSLPPDSIIKKTYYTPAPPLPLQKLKANSMARQQNSAEFKMINTLNEYSLRPIPVNAAGYLTHKKMLDEYYSAYNVLTNEKTHFKAESLSFDSSLLTMDTYRNEHQKKLAQQLEESVYLAEAFQIMCDFIADKLK